MKNYVCTNVNGPKEYREAMKHAEALDLEVSEVSWHGAWEEPDGTPVYLGGSDTPIEKAGYEYFHVKVSSPDGMIKIKVQPGRTKYKDSGNITLYLTD